MGFWFANSANRMNGDRKRGEPVPSPLTCRVHGVDALYPRKRLQQLPDALLLVRLSHSPSRSGSLTASYASMHVSSTKPLPSFHYFGCLLCSFSTWSIRSLHILMVDGLVGRRVGDGAVMTHFL